MILTAVDTSEDSPSKYPADSSGANYNSQRLSDTRKKEIFFALVFFSLDKLSTIGGGDVSFYRKIIHPSRPREPY